MKITFAGSIPPIQSAIKVGGDRTARLQIDIPESEIAQITKLIAYCTQKPLMITVEVAE